MLLEISMKAFTGSVGTTLISMQILPLHQPQLCHTLSTYSNASKGIES